MFKPNTLFYSDGYKVGHKRMLAPGTDFLYGTWIPRNLKHAPPGVTAIVSFGQQLTMKWLADEFEENFFKQPKATATLFGRDMSLYLGLPYDAHHFEVLHDLGYLPIRVKALPEGIETPAGIPHMTFINTVKGFAWLTLYLETIISSLAWKPSTSATIALQYRRNAEEWVKQTDPANAWLIPFMCHDFSARGLSPWDSLSSGLGHASSFKGSDSLIVIPGARYFYGEPEDQVCINSVNASEHSVSTTKIFTVGEQQMLSDWMKEFPEGILSVVSDTFDLWQLVTKFLPALKDEIMARPGKLVIRPDSGDPVDIVCGEGVIDVTDHKYIPKWQPDVAVEYMAEYLVDQERAETPHGKCGNDSPSGIFKYEGKYYKVNVEIDWNRHDKRFYYIDGWHMKDWEEIEPTPEMKGLIELLWDIFGGTVNEQGYKVLDSHIGAIYGDSINIQRQVAMYTRLAAKGFAATNIVLGVGSFTYQMTTRDTLGWAAKGGWFEAEGKEYDIYKEPKTGDGTKKSPKGLLAVHEVAPADNGPSEVYLVAQCTKKQEEAGMLRVIFEDGKHFNQTTLQEIRDRLLTL